MKAWISSVGAPTALTCAAFTLVTAVFFISIGQPAIKTIADMMVFAVGDSYSLSETLVKTIPIMMCALATAIPGRLGLISVGAEGQLHVGAIFGTAVMLVLPESFGLLGLCLVLVAAAIGGTLFGFIPGVLRVRLGINETITTLVMNYIGVLFVSALVYGPWRDPANQGWPATKSFPEDLILPFFFGTRVHAGLVIAIGIAVLLHLQFHRGTWSRQIKVLSGNRKVGETFGLNYAFTALLLMCLGGAVAGLAGIFEASAIQGRLQPGLSAGFGLTGFLVAWLSRHEPLMIVPVSFLVAGLISAGDALQLFAKIPAASSTILQGLLFATALAVPGLIKRYRGRYGN